MRLLRAKEAEFIFCELTLFAGPPQGLARGGQSTPPVPLAVFGHSSEVRFGGRRGPWRPGRFEPLWIAAVTAELSFKVRHCALILIHLVLFLINGCAVAIDVFPRILLLQALAGVRVKLHLILAKLLLEHFEFALVDLKTALKLLRARLIILLAMLTFGSA